MATATGENLDYDLAYRPARNSSFGSEYCETHVDAHFGFYRRLALTVRISKWFGFQVEHPNKGLLFESFQVQALRKRAPVPTITGSFRMASAESAGGSAWNCSVGTASSNDGKRSTVRPVAHHLRPARSERRCITKWCANYGHDSKRKLACVRACAYVRRIRLFAAVGVILIKEMLKELCLAHCRGNEAGQMNRYNRLNETTG